MKRKMKRIGLVAILGALSPLLLACQPDGDLLADRVLIEKQCVVATPLETGHVTVCIAECPEGMQVLGGGGRSNREDHAYVLVGSHTNIPIFPPDRDGTLWAVRFLNTGPPQAGTVWAIAICAATSSSAEISQ